MSATRSTAACWPSGSSPADLMAPSRVFSAALKSEDLRLLLASERYCSPGLMDGPLEHAARSSESGIIKERKRRCCIVVTPVLKRENRGVGAYLCGILSPAWSKSQWAQ